MHMILYVLHTAENVGWAGVNLVTEYKHMLLISIQVLSWHVME